MAPRRKKVAVGVDFSGPWFEHDPAALFGENVERLMKEMAEFGERDVKARIGSIGTGRTRDSYRGRVVSLSGKKWHRTAVVSPSTAGLSRKQAISLMAAASYIEGRYHPVRRAMADVRRFKRDLETKALKGLE